jgi:hypothetical protein
LVTLGTVDEDPKTEELRVEQSERERAERESETQAPTEEDTQTHRRRADKAAYLREKLEERAESERED